MSLFEITTLLISGFGAGVITGLIGASAVTFMGGILMVLLGYSAYDAIGIALMTDVSASLISAKIYRTAKNIDVKRGLIIAIFATIFSFLGGLIARSIPDIALGDGLGIITLITGIAFLRNPLKRDDTWIFNYFKTKKTLASILIGVLIGLFCGIIGVGGGINLLIALVFILGFPIKAAIGTSVLIMAFISLSGGIAHFINREFPLIAIIVASIGAIIGAIIGSKYSNKKSEETMFRVSGIILILISLVVIFKKFFTMIGMPFF